MVAPPPLAAIPPLPDDILFNIFSRLDNRRYLVSAMLVRRAWYHIAERLQYADIILRFPLFEEAGDRRATRCLRTLTNSNTAANAVRHLTVSGTLARQTVALLLDALRRTTRLISLELQMGNHTDEDGFLALWKDACESTQFLPQLSAINTDYAAAAISVARGRPLSVLGLPTLMESTVSRAVIDSLGNSSAPVTQLRLYIEVDNMPAALNILQGICRSFTSLHIISLQLRLPQPADVTWETFGTLLEDTAPSLSRLHSLRVLSLVLIPDPVDVDSRYEARTRELARRVVDHFPQLHRVELRWHGWFVSADRWTPVSQRSLLRQLDVWLYAEARHRLGFSRDAVS